MKKSLLIIFLLIVFSFHCLNAQTFCIGYGGSGNEYGYDIFTQDHNTFLVVGSTESFGAGGSADLYVMKLNQFGNILWTRTVGGFGNEIAYGIDRATNGDYVIAGETNTLGMGGGDMYVVRLDSSGNLLWTRSIGGDQYDVAKEIAATQDNGCVVAGTTGSFGMGLDDAYIAKLDSAGNVTWVRTMGSANTDGGYGVLATSDGNIAMVGRGFPGFGAAQPFVTKLTYGGVVLWSKHFSSHDVNDLFVPADIIEANGGYLISGFTDTVAGTNKNSFLTKISTSGNHQWTRIIGITGNDNGASIDAALDGGYLVTGTFFGSTANSFAIKTDSAGTPQWYTRSNVAGNSYAFGMIELNNGYFYSVGNNDALGQQQIFLIKYDHTGHSCCGDSIFSTAGYLVRNPGNYGTLGAGANLDTGGVAGSGGVAAFLCPPDTTATEIFPDTGVIQLDQDGMANGGEGGSTSGIGNEVDLNLQVFPNPTTAYINIQLSFPGEKIHYQLLNLQGQVLQTGLIVSNTSLLNIEHFQPGIYILQVDRYYFKIIKQ
jgi:hypothetical protein